MKLLAQLIGYAVLYFIGACVLTIAASILVAIVLGASQQHGPLATLLAFLAAISLWGAALKVSPVRNPEDPL